MYKCPNVSVVIPAYNEEESIGKVVRDLLLVESENGNPLFKNIVVCDNCSTDQTAAEARKAGAVTIYEPQAGYGIACQTALSALPQTDIIVFIDGDYSFYAEQSKKMVDEIRNGADLVIGSRVKGKIEKGALTPPQRIGNWLAARLIRIIWGVPITDLGPYRAITSDALAKIQMEDLRFGWTVEMQVKAIQMKMDIRECPVDTRVRVGVSKISGTVRGVIGAAIGIFGMIFKLWWRERTGKIAELKKTV